MKPTSSVLSDPDVAASVNEFGVVAAAFLHEHTDEQTVHVRDERITTVALGALRALIGATRRSPSLLRGVAHASYKHDNGFIKLVLLQQQQYPHEVRAHIWLPPSPGGADVLVSQNVHNHAADFMSVVLLGRATETFFREVPLDTSVEDSVSMFKFSCGSRGEEHSYRFQRLGPAMLARNAEEVISAGDVHAVRFHLLHRMRILQAPFVTFFVQGPRQQTGTVAYASSNAGPTEVIASPPLTVEDVAGYLEWLLQNVANSGGMD